MLQVIELTSFKQATAGQGGFYGSGGARGVSAGAPSTPVNPIAAQIEDTRLLAELADELHLEIDTPVGLGQRPILTDQQVIRVEKAS